MRSTIQPRCPPSQQPGFPASQLHPCYCPGSNHPTAERKLFTSKSKVERTDLFGNRDREVNNLLPGKDSAKHPSLPGQAAAALTSAGRAQEWSCQPGFDKHCGEFFSQGRGTLAKGLTATTGVK